MEPTIVKFSLHGKIRVAEIIEIYIDLINVVYQVTLDDGKIIQIMRNYFGEWEEIVTEPDGERKNRKTIMANLIGMEFIRIEYNVVSNSSFAVQVNFKGKVFDYVIDPFPPEEGSKYFKVVLGGKFQFHIWPPDGFMKKHWYAGAYTNTDPELVASIGQAIENHKQRGRTSDI
jgi:hypothetical protein